MKAKENQPTKKKRRWEIKRNNNEAVAATANERSERERRTQQKGMEFDILKVIVRLGVRRMRMHFITDFPHKCVNRIDQQLQTISNEWKQYLFCRITQKMKSKRQFENLEWKAKNTNKKQKKLDRKWYLTGITHTI